MSNPAKQKGTAFETLITNFLLRNGFPRVFRPALTGSGDVGDINGAGKSTPSGFKHVIFQCKNQKTFKLGQWMVATKDQAERKGNSQPVDAPPAVPILVVKRPGMGANNVGKNYGILELEDLAQLLLEAGYS